jgi:ribosomal protein L19
LIIKKIEKKRLKNTLRKNQKAIKYMTIIRGDFIKIWYINREREKGNIKYQFTKGLCIDARYKNYNSNIIIRSNIRNIIFEQIFNYFSLNNSNIIAKKNTIRKYKRNKLLFLRDKKNKLSKTY